ncbi:MAG TPA: phosphoenolpyruvate carboxylase, partial [Kofleriaceae bacterium]|nr:phosphoenolpyruvate carboxylase [Kofleriaceae bacterium]
TEQGETVTARYARAEIARRDLEQMVAAVLAASRGGVEAPAAELAERERLLGRAAERSRARYDQLVGGGEPLVRYACAATPIRQLTQLSLGSRPASRRPGLSLPDLRAIPWVFSWNQSRHGLPGWFGLGTALEAILADAGLDRARQLYRDWPFFRALVNNAQLALARADIDVASSYAALAGADGAPVFALIRDEHDRTMTHLSELAEGQPLLGNRPHLADAVRRRNPYVDVLSHAQIELLRRLDTAPTDSPQHDRLRAALFITINGIAAGLQTAG